MRTESRPGVCALGLAFFLLQSVNATLIPRLSFEQLTDSSELVVFGHVTNSWAAWDSEHKYIWTHYTLSVDSTLKGARSRTIEFAEPGGVVGDRAMSIAGSIIYGPGENVVVFLSRMPNGYLRTSGWAQGKFAVDSRGRVHGQAGIGAETMSVNGGSTGLRLATLEGMSVSDLGRMVSNRIQAQGRTK